MASQIITIDNVGAKLITIDDVSTEVITVDTVKVITIEGVGLQGASGEGVSVTSFNTRLGAVTPILDDYQASLITNDSTEVGATVKDSLDALDIEQGDQDSRLDQIDLGQISQDTLIQFNTDEIGTLSAGNYILGDNVGQDLGLLDTQVKTNADNIANLPPIAWGSITGTLSDQTDLKNQQDSQDSAIALNTAKRSYPLADENRLANTSGTNTGDQDISGIAINASDIDDLEAGQLVQDANIQANADDITALDSRVTTNEANISTNAGDITTLNNEQVVQDGRLDVIEAEQIVQNDDIADLQENVIVSSDDSPNHTDSIWRGNQSSFDQVTPISGKLYIINNVLYSSNETVIQIDTTQAGSASDTFVFPLTSMGGLPSIEIDWGDGSSDVITSVGQAELTHVYSVSGTYDVIITGELGYLWSFSNAGDKSKLITFGNKGNTTLTTLHFSGCNNFTGFTTLEDFKAKSTNIDQAFRSCSSFDSDLSLWDMIGVLSCSNMFQACLNFNGNISTWNVSTIVNFASFLFQSSSFDQDLSLWNPASCTSMNYMLSNTGLSPANLDLIYNSWSLLTLQPNVVFRADPTQYTALGQLGRDTLVNAPNNWTITDGGLQP